MFSNVRWITSEESHLRFHMNVHTYAEVHTSYVEVHTYAEMHMFTHTHTLAPEDTQNKHNKTS